MCMCVSGKRWCACAGVAGVAAMHVTRHSCHTLDSRHFLTSGLQFFSVFFTLAYFDGEGGQALCFHFKMYYMSSRERELENVYFESVLQHWLFLFHKMEINMIILAYLSRVGTLKGIYLVLDCSFPPSFAVGRDRKLALVHTTKSL